MEATRTSIGNVPGGSIFDCLAEIEPLRGPWLLRHMMKMFLYSSFFACQGSISHIWRAHLHKSVRH